MHIGACLSVSRHLREIHLGIWSVKSSERVEQRNKMIRTDNFVFPRIQVFRSKLNRIEPKLAGNGQTWPDDWPNVKTYALMYINHSCSKLYKTWMWNVESGHHTGVFCALRVPSAPTPWTLYKILQLSTNGWMLENPNTNATPMFSEKSRPLVCGWLPLGFSLTNVPSPIPHESFAAQGNSMLHFCVVWNKLFCMIFLFCMTSCGVLHHTFLAIDGICSATTWVVGRAIHITSNSRAIPQCRGTCTRILSAARICSWFPNPV